MPFAGISFLWFIGVLRDGLGTYEDRFFATLFLGSGLLFLAMMFVATAVAAALLATNTGVVDPAAHAEIINFGKMVVLAAAKTYAIRMAAVFMISLSTIWKRTGLMPLWLVLASYLVALMLLIASDLVTDAGVPGVGAGGQRSDPCSFRVHRPGPRSRIPSLAPWLWLLRRR